MEKLSALELKMYTLRLEIRGMFLIVRRINDLHSIVGSVKDWNPVKGLSA